MSVKVKVNGKEETLPEALTIEEYLEKRSVQREVIAAHNGEVVDKDRWSKVILEDGDSLEIIKIVGGG